MNTTTSPAGSVLPGKNPTKPPNMVLTEILRGPVR